MDDRILLQHVFPVRCWMWGQCADTTTISRTAHTTTLTPVMYKL
jgi:hypothetical protein